MDNQILKKKLSAYVSDKGYLKNLSEDILYEVLVAWEHWTGPSKEFYRSLGFSQRQMASIIGKAKKLKREGHYGEGEFKQVTVDPDGIPAGMVSLEAPIEIVWGGGKIIRFTQVDHLVEFLKKSA